MSSSQYPYAVLLPEGVPAKRGEKASLKPTYQLQDTGIDKEVTTKEWPDHGQAVQPGRTWEPANIAASIRAIFLMMQST